MSIAEAQQDMPDRDENGKPHRHANLRAVVWGLVIAAALVTFINGIPHMASASIRSSALERQRVGGLLPQEQAAADQLANRFTEQISNVEWLAPLAPIALSPFFGLTLLSGMACYGPDWLSDNPLLNERSPFADPRFFWIFLVLTVITSLPRFSKVSKPIAQFADFLETWSAIVILVFIRLFAVTTEAPETEMAVQAGILSVGWQGLLIVAMVINLIVINSVKFFFEFLVWVTPIPFLDACFEVANKSFCAALMAVYAFSPMVALLLNLILFLACLMVFAWIRRREFFYRSMLIDWVVVWWKRSVSTKSAATTIPERLTVFPHDKMGSIPARARCQLVNRGESGWTLIWPRWLRPTVTEELSGLAELDRGWWTNAIVLDDGRRLTFGCRYDHELIELASAFSLQLGTSPQPTDAQVAREVDFA